MESPKYSQPKTCVYQDALCRYPLLLQTWLKILSKRSSLFCQPDKSYAELFFGVSLDSEDEEDDDPLEHVQKVHHLQNIQL